MSWARWALFATALSLCGCMGPQQSATNPAGPQAGSIHSLLTFFLVVAGAVFVLVMGMTVWALARGHRGIDQEPLEHSHMPSAETERGLTKMVTGATIATVLILFVLLTLSVTTGKSISELGDHKNGMVVEVTGNQWWWYVRYMNDDASRIVVTANEIHIPVGRPVMIRGNSHDVIHSFWVPSLSGKRDLIPGRTTTQWLQADRPGRFRGQCAEFCGLQHAHMALWVVAEPQDQFDRWMERQLQPAVAPDNADKQRGQQVFMANACIFCHTIQGTPAAGQLAPDLTHLASRFTIAAGTLPNTKGNLGGWILDPQGIKPGNHMAAINLKPDDVQPLLDYLESLQ